MSGWILVLCLVLGGITFTGGQQGTILKETCQLFIFQFNRFSIEETTDTETIPKPGKASLAYLKTFIEEEVKCSNFTKVSFHDVMYKREFDSLAADITFTIEPNDGLNDVGERQAKPIICVESIKTKVPNQQEKLKASVRLNISGSIKTALFVSPREVSCCERLYGSIKKEPCCRTGFIEYGDKCACPVGKFLDVNTTRCESCPADTYQPNNKSIKCEPCPNGTTTHNTTGATSNTTCQKACSPGQRFHLGIKNCTACPKNTYQPLTGQLKCETCPNNRVTNDTGNTRLGDCVQSCHPGSFYDFKNGRCELCTRDFYQPNQSQFSCIPCKSGRVTLQNGSRSARDCIIDCNMGFFYDFNTTNCLPCPLNFYQSLRRQLYCSRCPDSRITINVSSSKLEDCIENCSPGFSFNFTIRRCQECRLNSYQPQNGQTECISCPDGKITINVSSSRQQDCIKNCTPGSAFNYTTRDCQSCPLNFFQPQPGKTECIACRNNRITTNTSSSKLDNCIKECPPGSAYDFVQEDCQECPLNSYQPQPGTANCISCPDGKITINVSSTSLQDCIKNCPPGTAFSYSIPDCQGCPLNFFQTQSGKTECTRCPTGRITVNTSTSRLEDCIKDCRQGSAYNFTTQDCQACPLNFFQPQSGKTKCFPCPNRKITINVSSSSLQDCIENCPPGSAFSYTTRACQPCPVNFFQPKAGKIQCISCPDGKITRNVSSSRSQDCIEECAPGLRYSSEKESCILCPLNTYKPTKGETECIPCPKGKITINDIFTPNTNETDCVEECAEGEFYNPSTRKCTKCPRNTTQDNRGQTVCIPCKDGKITEKEGSISVNDCIAICPAGQFYNKNLFKCQSCEYNYYQAKAGTSKCLPCPNGTVTFEKKTKSIQDCVKACPAGSHHVNRTAQCALCDTNSYQDKIGKETCESCLSRKTFQKGSTKEKDCFEVCDGGQYHDNTTRQCVQCEMDHYQPKQRQFSCEPCPNGTLTRSTGSRLKSDCILDCHEGFTYNSTLRTCVACAIGTYKDIRGHDSCTLCGKDETTERTGSKDRNDCIAKCRRGEYFNRTRNRCLQCPRGFYQPRDGQVRCDKCPSGQTTLFTGSQAMDSCYKDCPRGHYYNLKLDNCLPCPFGQFQPESGQNKCKKCSFPILTTYKNGSVNSSACRIACSPGEYFNTTKYDKCEPCPQNTYQNLSAATSCKSCPDNGITEETGRKTIEECQQPISATSGTTSEHVVAIVSSTVSAFVLLLVLAFVCFYQRRKIKEKRRMSSRPLTPRSASAGSSTFGSRQKLDSLISMKNHHYKLEGSGLAPEVVRPHTRTANIPKHLEISRDRLKFVGEVLGKGNFGRVEKAHLLKHGREIVVAVKMIKGGGSFSDEKELFDELEMLASLYPHPHENIVNLIGGSTTSDGPLFVVVEYCANGNLLKYLQRNQTQAKPKAEYVNIFPKAPKPTIQYEWKLKKALEICCGMAHLARYKIIHRDVAARNVLLDANWVAKISDFGMARDIYVQQIYRKDTEGFLPVRWMAIESLESFIYTSQSDVWSFGILMWEIITDGRVPYNNILDHSQLLVYIKSGKIMKRPKNCPKDYYHMMEKCWATNPSSRPTFDDLLEGIRILYENEVHKYEPLPQKILRKFSSKRKRRKPDEDGDNQNGRGTGLAGAKSRLQKTLSNTSGNKIEKIEEEQVFLDNGGKPEGDVMKMKVLESPEHGQGFEKARVNEGYDRTGSFTSNETDSRKSQKSGESYPDERINVTSVTISEDEDFVTLQEKTKDHIPQEIIPESSIKGSLGSKPAEEEDDKILVDDRTMLTDTDSDSVLSLTLRTDRNSEANAPLASGESDSDFSRSDDWASQPKEGDTSSNC